MFEDFGQDEFRLYISDRGLPALGAKTCVRARYVCIFVCSSLQNEPKQPRPT